MLTFSGKSGFKQTTAASFGCFGDMELQWQMIKRQPVSRWVCRQTVLVLLDWIVAYAERSLH